MILKAILLLKKKRIKSNAVNALMAELTVRGAVRIVNKMTDAEVIELLREIKRLRDCVRTLVNHNKRIINQNKELQQELRNLTQK